MKNKTIAVHLIFNAIMIVLDIVLFSPGFVGLTAGSGSSAVTAGFYTAILVSLFLYIAGNLYIHRQHGSGGAHEYDHHQSLDQENRPQDSVRHMLEEYRPLRPKLHSEIDRALEQLSSIGRKQVKVEKLFERNRYSVQSVLDTLREAEAAIDRNLHKCVNYITIWDPAEAGKPGKEALYAGHRSSIHAILDTNEEILGGADVLLTEVTKYISETKDGHVVQGVGLQSMIAALQQLNKTEI